MTQDMSERLTALKPCPICDARTAVLEELDEAEHRVKCQECGLQTLLCITPESAVDRWNTRAQSAHITRLAGALEPFVEAANPIVNDFKFDADAWSELVCKLSVGDFRKAHAALEALRNTEGTKED